MEQSLLFVQVFGPLFILLGISMMINKKWYMKLFKELQEHHLSIFIFSVISFIGGMYILGNFSGRSNQYEYFATFMGIIITLKSAFYILTPNAMRKLGKQVKPLVKNIHYIGVLWLLIGIYISYIAYI